MPTILNVIKAPPPATPEPPREITHIDVRLTRDEAFMIGAFASRTNYPVGNAMLPPHKSAPGAEGGGKIAIRLYIAMRDVLGLPTTGFNDKNNYIALVRTNASIGDDGFVISKESKSQPQYVNLAHGVSYTTVEAARRIESDAEYITQLREERDALKKRAEEAEKAQSIYVKFADGNSASYTPNHAAARIANLTAEVERLTRELTDTKSHVSALNNEVINLREKNDAQRKIIEENKRALNTATKMFDDIKRICDEEYEDYK